MDAALDEELVALADILLHLLGELAPGDDVVPLGALGYLCAVGQSVGWLMGGQREGGYRAVGIDVADIRVAAYVANEEGFVEGHGLMA